MCVLETVGAWGEVKKSEDQEISTGFGNMETYGENFRGVLGVKPRLVGDE